MPDKIVMDELDNLIERLSAITPDVFLSSREVGYVKAWKHGNMFCLECKRADGMWYHGRFFEVGQILSISKRYFDALQIGEDLLCVMHVASYA